jgi:hypothetical protein
MPPASPSAAQSPPTTTDAPDRAPFFPSPFAHFRWPEFTMPKPQLPRTPGQAEADKARNAWVENSPDPARPSPWQAVTQGANRVGQSTKAAWRKTVDVLTPGEPTTAPPPRVAERNAQPSFWRRMFPGGDQQPTEGPRTVNEWMGQERLQH